MNSGLSSQVSSSCSDVNASALSKDVKSYQKFLKTTFPKRAQKHSPYLELCLPHAFDSCSEEHNSVPTDISLIYDVQSSLMQSIESMSDVSAKDDLKARLEEVYKVHFDYLGHLLRTKHQGDYYKFVLKYLKPGEYIMVIDYKMLCNYIGTKEIVYMRKEFNSPGLVWDTILAAVSLF